MDPTDHPRSFYSKDGPEQAFPVLDPRHQPAAASHIRPRSFSLAFVPGLFLFLLIIAGVLGMEACAGSRLSALTGKQPAPIILEIEQPDPLQGADEFSLLSGLSTIWSWMHP